MPKADRSCVDGAGGTPITPYTDALSNPFKGTHELSPMAGVTPSASLAQWPQELEAALDNMAATRQAYLGRYDLCEDTPRLHGPQGIVAFATCNMTQQKVRNEENLFESCICE